MDRITEYIKNTWRNRPEKCRLTLTDVLTGVVSGLVVGLLLFVFACVFAELIFGAHPELAKSLDIGVLEQTLTVLVGSLLTVMMSGNPVAIAGPDITTALFMTSAAKQVAIAIVAMPDVDNAAVLPTVLVMIALVTVVIGVLWIVMGYYSITRALEYMPAPILAGFVASIGYKVLCKAVDTATGAHTSLAYWGVESAPLEVAHFAKWETWVHLAPAVPIGVGMFVLKREHWGAPYIYIPLIIFAPVAIFYGLLSATDVSMQEAREQSWFFPEFNKTSFWVLWEKLYYGLFENEVCWAAIPAAAAPLSVLVLMLTIDMLGQQVATKKLLQMPELSLEIETIVTGIILIPLGLLGGAPAFTQIKFNTMNYGIVNSKTNWIPGVVCAIFNGVIFVSGFPVINFLPRFLLSGLVLFVAISFLNQHLVDTLRGPTKMNLVDYLTVWAIVLTTAFSEMLYGVIVGLLISVVVFVFRYTLGGIIAIKDESSAGKRGLERLSCVDGGWTKVVRPRSDKAKLRGLEDLAMVAEVCQYLFFGSLCELQLTINEWLAERRKRLPRCRQERLLLLDFSGVAGMDARLLTPAAMLEVVEIVKQVAAAGVETIFTGIDPYDTKGACYRLPIIAAVDSEIEWVWCGDRGCDAKPIENPHEHHSEDAEAEAAAADGVSVGSSSSSGNGGGAAVEMVAAHGGAEGDGGASAASHADSHADSHAKEGHSHGHGHGHERSRLKVRGFATVEDGVEYIEDELLHWAASVRRRWLVVESFKKHHTKQVQRERHNEVEPNVEDELLPFVTIESYDTGDVICSQGEVDRRPNACRAASRMAHGYKCVCDVAAQLGKKEALESCQTKDHRPCLLHILSGRVRVTQQTTHGDVRTAGFLMYLLLITHTYISPCFHRLEQVHAGVHPSDVRCSGLSPGCTCARAIERAAETLAESGSAEHPSKKGGRPKSVRSTLFQQKEGSDVRKSTAPRRHFDGTVPPKCFEVVRQRGVSHEAARPEFLEAAGLFNPVGWAVEARRPGSTKWVNARVLEVLAHRGSLAQLRARFHFQLATDRSFELEYEPPLSTVAIATHQQFVNASSLFGSDRVEYTVTAKEPTVVLSYHPCALDRMEITAPKVFATLAKTVMANMAWQNSILNADHSHDYFFQSSEHVKCEADGSVDEDRIETEGYDVASRTGSMFGFVSKLDLFENNGDGTSAIFSPTDLPAIGELELTLPSKVMTPLSSGERRGVTASALAGDAASLLLGTPPSGSHRLRPVTGGSIMSSSRPNKSRNGSMTRRASLQELAGGNTAGTRSRRASIGGDIDELERSHWHVGHHFHFADADSRASSPGGTRRSQDSDAGGSSPVPSSPRLGGGAVSSLDTMWPNLHLSKLMKSHALDSFKMHAHALAQSAWSAGSLPTAVRGTVKMLNRKELFACVLPQTFGDRLFDYPAFHALTLTINITLSLSLSHTHTHLFE